MALGATLVPAVEAQPIALAGVTVRRGEPAGAYASRDRGARASRARDRAAAPRRARAASRGRRSAAPRAAHAVARDGRRPAFYSPLHTQTETQPGHSTHFLRTTQ